MNQIHPTAIIDPSVVLGEDVTIGAYAIINADVEIGDNCWIGPHVMINGPTKMGAENKIYQFSSIGEAPQDLKYAGEPTHLEMGDRNVIREHCTFNRGTVSGGGITRVGDDNLFMAYVHLAHDCQVGNKTIFANNSSLAGHVSVGDQAILGGFTIVHQFTSIGAHAFTGLGSVVLKDLPPYVIANGYPAVPHGINKEGLKRRGFNPDEIMKIRRAYKVLYRSGLSLEDAKQELLKLGEESKAVKVFADFIINAKRSIARAK